MAERQLPKLNVAGSIPVSRSMSFQIRLTEPVLSRHTVSDEKDEPVRDPLLHVHVHVYQVRAAGGTLLTSS